MHMGLARCKLHHAPTTTRCTDSWISCIFVSTSLDDVVVKGAEIPARDTRRGYELWLMFFFCGGYHDSCFFRRDTMTRVILTVAFLHVVVLPPSLLSLLRLRSLLTLYHTGVVEFSGSLFILGYSSYHVTFWCAVFLFHARKSPIISWLHVLVFHSALLCSYFMLGDFYFLTHVGTPRVPKFVYFSSSPTWTSNLLVSLPNLLDVTRHGHHLA
jgi:hypothetical protein